MLFLIAAIMTEGCITAPGRAAQSGAKVMVGAHCMQSQDMRKLERMTVNQSLEGAGRIGIACPGEALPPAVDAWLYGQH